MPKLGESITGAGHFNWYNGRGEEGDWLYIYLSLQSFFVSLAPQLFYSSPNAAASLVITDHGVWDKFLWIWLEIVNENF